MMRQLVRAGVIWTIAVAMSACSSGGSSAGSNPNAPSPSPSPSSNATTVAIVGESGPGAFQPNPVSATVGTTVQWKNDDVTIHHIVLDDGSADLGTMAPGSTSGTIAVTSTAPIHFHCTIHPSMVGTINGSDAAADPGQMYSAATQR
jgi:plastocyanin